jgi:hypothetical protein
MKQPPEQFLSDSALDAVLQRVLWPPALPAQFQVRLQAALARARTAPGLPEARLQLEQERRELLQELQASYVRLRRRSLGTMIGGAFAAGAVSVWAMPWLEAHLGNLGPQALAAAGALVGLTVGLLAWRERVGTP